MTERIHYSLYLNSGGNLFPPHKEETPSTNTSTSSNTQNTPASSNNKEESRMKRSHSWYVNFLNWFRW